MPATREAAADGVRVVLRTVLHGQGIAGVLCLAGGCFLVAGLGVALIILGVFLLLGAWSTR